MSHLPARPATTPFQTSACSEQVAAESLTNRGSRPGPRCSRRPAADNAPYEPENLTTASLAEPVTRTVEDLVCPSSVELI